MTSSLLDTALDLSVIGGYTNVGYRIRSRGWKPLPRMEGKVVLITGATSGLGLAAAGGFARLGATVWLAVRNRERGEAARARILEHQGEADVHVELCDLSRLESVRRFAERFTAAAPRLDVLVNNAGVLTQEREVSADGIELTFAVNVLAGHLLTRELVPALRASDSARVINVSSGGMYTRRLCADDLQSERERFEGAAVYARSKRAEVVLTELWARELAPTSVSVHAMHPGWADTPGVAAGLPGFHRAMRRLLRTPEQGADTVVGLASAEAPLTSTAGFWLDRRRRSEHRVPWTRGGDGTALWELGEKRSGWEGP